MKYFLIMPLLLVYQVAFSATEKTAVTPSIGPNYSQSIVSMLLALGAVICVLLIAVWLSKKIGVGKFASNSELSIKSHLALSQKEKLVVVKYKGKQILLGVAPGCVNCIDMSDIDDEKPLTLASDNTSFASRLMAVIKDKSKSTTPNDEI